MTDVATSLEQAQALESTQQFSAATEAYAAALVEKPENIEAILGLARCAGAQGNHAEALMHFQQALALNPSNQWRRFDVAEALLSQKRTQEAQELFTALAAEFPETAVFHRGLGKCAWALNNRKTALAYFAEAYHLAPEEPWRRYDYAIALYGLENWREAATHLCVLAKLLPNHEDIFSRLADCETRLDLWPDYREAERLFGAGQLQEAEALYAEIAAIKPLEPTFHTGLGQCARARGKPDDALIHFQEALRLAPDNVWRLCDVAEMLRAMERFDEAEERYKAILAVESGHTLARFGLAQCTRAQSSAAASVEQFAALCQEAPDNIWPRIEYAADLKTLGRLDEAEAEYQHVLTSSDRNTAALIGLGQCFMKRGQTSMAFQYLESAAQSMPDDSWPRLELINAHRTVGNFSEARKLLERLCEAPGGVAVWLSVAETERAAGDHAAALAAFRTAHEMAPDQVEIILDMAMEERVLGHLQAYETLSSRAHALAPNNPNVLCHLAEYETARKNLPRALQLYQAAAAAQPRLLMTHAGIADNLAALGETDAALTYLEALEQSFSQVAELRARRVMLLRQAGRYPDAIALARRATADAPLDSWLWEERLQSELFGGSNAEIEDCLNRMPAASRVERSRCHRYAGRYAELRGHFAEAVRQYEAAAALTPEDPVVQHEQVRIRLMMLDVEGAMMTLRRAGKLDAPYTEILGKSRNISQTHYGQIIDEYRLDTLLTAELSALQLLPPSGRIKKLVPLTHENPDSIAPATALMVAMREARLLYRHPAPGMTEIPRRVT